MARAEILIVEDDTEMASVLREGFENDYNVAIAHDGEHGLRMAMGHQFQVIVLDVMLPVLDGFEVASALRATGNQTPILMLTARDSVADSVRGFDCGIEDYVTKPFSFLNLAARIRALIRRSSPRVSRLEADGLVMDTAARLVTRDGRVIHLTRTEYDVLEILLRNPGTVVRRPDLLYAVWGLGAGAAGNNLHVTISALRAKVDRGAGAPLIHTVRGFGYRISAPGAK